MRLRYKKGIPPEAIIESIGDYLKDKVIGSVNVYIQEYDENMKPVKFDCGCISFEATDFGKKMYDEDAAQIRRSKMKAV